MTWLRQQPTGHNVLIGGSGNSQLYAGDGGDLLIGSSAQFENGQFVLGEANGTKDGGRDVMEGGNGTGQDLMIGGVGGDAMLAGTGNSVLIGGTGEDILEGGAGNDVLVGGSLINVLMSNDAAGGKSYLLGGTGLNFEFAGAGNDQLFDYSNPSDPLQANAWNVAQGLAAEYHVALPTSSAGPNTEQTLQDLQDAANAISSQVELLNDFTPTPGNLPQLTEYGTITAGSSAVTNLYFLSQQSGTISGTTLNVVTGLSTATLQKLADGVIVTGSGIPTGTTITKVNTNNIVLSNNVSTPGNYSLTFTYPLTLAPTWESGNVARGSNKVTGLEQPIGATGELTKNSNAITNFSSSSHVAVGDWVTAPGIPANTYITQIQSDQSILLSNIAGANATQEQLTISAPLAVGEPVSGSGIPAGTTIASIGSGTVDHALE